MVQKVNRNPKREMKKGKKKMAMSLGTRVLELCLSRYVIRDRKISSFFLFHSLTYTIPAFTLVIFSPQTREMLSPCLAPLELPEWVEKSMIKKTITPKKI
jgi:hypothetical protein